MPAVQHLHPQRLQHTTLLLAASALSLLTLNTPSAATRGKPPTNITIRSGATAHFANLNWNCSQIPLQLLGGGTTPLLSCKDNTSGLILLVTRTHLELKTCQNGHCTTLLRRNRAP
jgi:hypothetical protein